MFERIDHLNLSEKYEFAVAIRDGGNTFAAKLSLSPQRIILEITGESSKERSYSGGFDDLDYLVCWDVNKRFFLHNLKFVKGGSRVITHQPVPINFFNVVFDVGYLVFSPSNSGSNFVKKLIVHSPSVNEWIGSTRNQYVIAEKHSEKDPEFWSIPEMEEFSIKIDGIGFLVAAYNPQIHWTPDEFSAGIKFPPSLFLLLSEQKDTYNLMDLFYSTYNILSFFMGKELKIDRVDVDIDSGPYTKLATLYFPFDQISYHVSHQNYSFFPLSRNLHHDTLGLPELPLESINRYFSLNKTNHGYFSKYIRYRRMDNPEERFLGFFRLLESITYKEKKFLDGELLESLCNKVKPYLQKKFNDKSAVDSFLKGIPNYNKRKYNTEKCVGDFYKRIPNHTSAGWVLNKSDLFSICKLRNDITHANDYFVSEEDLHKKTKFTEILLVYALLDLLSVDFEIVSKIIDRFNGYHLIVRRPEPIYSHIDNIG